MLTLNLVPYNSEDNSSNKSSISSITNNGYFDDEKTKEITISSTTEEPDETKEAADNQTNESMLEYQRIGWERFTIEIPNELKKIDNTQNLPNYKIMLSNGDTVFFTYYSPSMYTADTGNYDITPDDVYELLKEAAFYNDKIYYYEAYYGVIPCVKPDFNLEKDPAKLIAFSDSNNSETKDFIFDIVNHASESAAFNK